MTDSEKMDFTVSVFAALTGQHEDRMTYAVRNRKALHDAIDRGETPKGARADWVKASAQAVTKLMGELAEQYDKANPHDKATVGDVMDVLSTTAGWFDGSD